MTALSILLHIITESLGCLIRILSAERGHQTKPYSQYIQMPWPQHTQTELNDCVLKPRKIEYRITNRQKLNPIHKTIIHCLMVLNSHRNETKAF